VANTTGAATAALVIPCKIERLETTIDHILRVSAILAVLSKNIVAYGNICVSVLRPFA
jgi:hypothetical protein